MDVVDLIFAGRRWPQMFFQKMHDHSWIRVGRLDLFAIWKL